MYKRIAGFWLSFLVGLAGCSLAAADPVAKSSTQKLIIRLMDDGTRRIQALARDDAVPDISLSDGRALRFVRRFNGDGMVVRLPEKVSLEQAQRIAEQLSANPAIASVQPDKRMYPALVPNDTFYLPGTDPFPLGQWHLFEDTAGIRMQEAWDQETGSNAVVIAQLDTGIIPHRDLNPARILPNGFVEPGYDFISDVFAANDGDARDPDATDPGDATDDDDCGPGVPGEDSSWHGLSVAGVMVAEADNLTDIAGMDFAARLLPLRVLGRCGGDLSDVADAIRWAAGLPVAGIPDNPTPARVINLSLSGAGACTNEEQNAINAAVDAGAVVVVAAGNQGGDVANISPANCNKVITVGAIARDGTRASYTNTGEEVSLSAPGGDTPDPPDPLNPPNGILTLSNTGLTTPGLDILASIQGTSFTAAQVSAVTALMWAVNNTLTPGMIENLLVRTTRAFPDISCTAALCGTGVLDANAALVGALDPAVVLGARVTGGTGGSGCAIRQTSGFDPMLVLLVMIAAAAVFRRRRRNR